MVEFEAQRYQPRWALTKLLQDADLVQIVAGTPAWANVVGDIPKPICLQAATLIDVERRARLHGYSPVTVWQRAMTVVNERLERSVLPRMDAIFVENDWMYQECIRRTSPDRVHLAPPGVDEKLFHPDSYRPNSYILSVGRFSDARKNIRLLFDAYSKLTQSAPKNVPDLVLAGTAPTGNDLNYMRSLGIGARVKIRERVSQDALARLYREASLFVLSSNEEGLGLVLLEAMSSGIPVVSTDCGGPRTAITEGDTGFLTPVGDSGRLAKAMQLLIEAPALAAAMGEAGRRRICEHFSLDVAGRRFTDVYTRLLRM